MKYKGFTSNVLPVSKNDCVVRALAVVCKLDYATVFYAMKEEGRRDSSGFPIDSWLVHKQKLRAFGHRFVRQEVTNRGTYLCWNGGHAWAVVDGILHDYRFANRRHTDSFLVEKMENEIDGTEELLARAKAIADLALRD